MKRFVIVLKILVIFLLFDFAKVEGQTSRLWLEIDSALYYIDPNACCTWKQAVSECKTVQSDLIAVKGDYNYANLKNAIKNNFKNYSSFWSSAQVKTSSFFHFFGLGQEQYNRQKCYKFDNSSTFKFLPENCGIHLGFICEKALLKSGSLFYSTNKVYFVQPKQRFTCEQAYEQCEKRKMHLMLAEEKENDKILNDLVFINYGSTVKFWFGFTNETKYNCQTVPRNRFVQQDAKLGFICHKSSSEKKGVLTGRHIILLIFVAVAAVLAITVFILIKCFAFRRMRTFVLPEEDIRKDIIVTDIK